MRSVSQFVVFPWWPEEGHGWIHPRDIALVQRLIPSLRVFRRERFCGEFNHLRYGPSRIRIRPVMGMPIEGEGLMIGDQVEVRTEGLQREGLVATILHMTFNRRDRRIEYTLRRGNRKLPHRFLATDLRFLTTSRRLPAVRQWRAGT